VSRNTVRRVLRSGETSFEYERTVQPRPKLARWTSDLDVLLEGNATKTARERLTLIRIFEELRGRGYDGGYDAVRRYAGRWSKDTIACPIFDDWSYVSLSGRTRANRWASELGWPKRPHIPESRFSRSFIGARRRPFLPHNGPGDAPRG
jgi:hypothetical protein